MLVVLISTVMVTAPRSVKAQDDQDEFAMGGFGRWIVVFSPMIYCLSIPIWDFVLSGALVDSLFPNAFSQSTWDRRHANVACVDNARERRRRVRQLRQ